MTQYPDLFAALAAPFDRDEIKSRSLKGRAFEYATARVYMNRLDSVLGPENWWDDYTPGQSSVLCRLTIRLPDGSTLTKSDAGGMAGMEDAGDDEKSGFSDSFKRSCVKFGIGRFLYRDGVPSFVRDREPVPAAVEPRTIVEPPPRQGGPERPYHSASPRDGRQLYAWADREGRARGIDLVRRLEDWARPQGFPRYLNKWNAAQVAKGLAKAVKALAEIDDQAGAA